MIAFSDVATFELPSPEGDLSETLAAFGSRGFDLRETVSLLGKTFLVYSSFYVTRNFMIFVCIELLLHFSVIFVHLTDCLMGWFYTSIQFGL